MPQAALTGGAPKTITRDFPFQSWFDTTALQQAIAVQNTAIVLPKAAQDGGVAVQLHPASMTPVAIDFTLAGGINSGPVFVKPGQVIRPGKFSAFTWGLPFGWLGGGVASLVVAQNEKTDFAAPAQAEVIFHRMRIKVNARAATVAPLTLINWPIRFPWPNAIALSGAVAMAQGQLPVAGVVYPTRIVARLRVATVPAGGAQTRFIFFNTDDFDRDSNYLAQASGALGGAPALDVAWQPWATSGITITGGSGTTEFQVQEIDTLQAPVQRLGGDSCSVIVVDTTVGGDVVANQFIDVVRYGVL